MTPGRKWKKEQGHMATVPVGRQCQPGNSFSRKIPAGAYFFTNSRPFRRRIYLNYYKCLGGFGYAEYFCIYLFMCIWAIVKKYEEFRAYLNRDNHWAVAISLVVYFSFYFLLYIFGAAIFKGPRHPLAQYIPALFVMFYFLSKFGFSHYSQKLKCQFNTREVHIAVFCLLVLDLAFQMPYKLYKVFLGW